METELVVPRAAMGEIAVRGKEGRQDLESSWCNPPPPSVNVHVAPLRLRIGVKQ